MGVNKRNVEIASSSFLTKGLPAMTDWEDGFFDRLRMTAVRKYHLTLRFFKFVTS